MLEKYAVSGTSLNRLPVTRAVKPNAHSCVNRATACSVTNSLPSTDTSSNVDRKQVILIAGGGTSLGLNVTWLFWKRMRPSNRTPGVESTCSGGGGWSVRF